MIAILIIGQLDHFEFATIVSPKVAGDSFSITIYAYDSLNQIVTNYNGHPWVYSSLGPTYSNKQVSFTNGVCMENVMVTLASNMALICNNYQGQTGQSNNFDVRSNDPARLLVIVPNQTYEPGTQSGKSGTVSGQTAGTSFVLTLYATDIWYNCIDTINHTVAITSSDPFIPASQTQFTNGMASVPFAFRTAGSRVIYANDVTNPGLAPDTSSAISVYAGTYAELLVLLPGETHVQGDTSSSTPGKIGNPDDQYVLEDFTVTVYATDSMWNRTSVTGNAVTLRSNFPGNLPITQNLNNGETQFTVQFSTVDDNQNVWAEDLPISSYMNYLDIIARATNMAITVDPDTILAGGNALVTATVYDLAGQPIDGKSVIFTVVHGNGYIYDAQPYTNSSGTATARFGISSVYFNELDTIGITADDNSFYGTCYVLVPDSSIIGGNVIAYPNPMGFSSQVMSFTYYLEGPSNIIFEIYDPFGNLVYKDNKSPNENGASRGINILTWDGRNDKGRRVASGLYYVVLKAWTHTATIFNKQIKVGVVW